MRKIVLWLLDKLPGCMYEITGKKWICPKYWIVEKAGAKDFWRKVGWITCAKEIRRRIDDGRGVQETVNFVRGRGEKKVRRMSEAKDREDSVKEVIAERIQREIRRKS